MLNQQYLLNLTTISLLLLPITPVIAQPASNPSGTESEGLSTGVLFKPPPEEKKPEHTRGAGSRNQGQCSQELFSANESNAPLTQTSLIPLVPSSNWGLTTAQRPTFWINLPETSAQQIVLSVREEGRIFHSQTFISITGKSGLISVQPSQDSPPLELDKSYQWAVVLICGDQPTPNDPAIASWIKRVTITEPNDLGTPLQQVAWYGEKGIWYDAVTTLIEVRQSQPNNQNIRDIWTKFLKSGEINSGLERY
ncbi:DUF928 domain-containing protein [Crocosphaera chwakensis]|uniref:DUF928 domain-containing protein n=1 Tax=Crocosphaera chwakensis CCY0110 TaxID=391612 RepID=A3ILA4_9CHRO|nr:DUF928 domain-containing protein [Crocosphaera chwakensis]EAZ92973.1 hypothetical protein CY0110_22792 [Crocosphaera chwakensis CCY0110]